MLLRSAWPLVVASSAFGIMLMAASVPASAQEGGSKGGPTTAPFPNTPEGAYKAFVFAMATGDEKALRQSILAADGIEWLLKGQHIPPEHAAEFRKDLEARMVIKRLKPGDRFTLPGGQEITVPAEDVTEDRAVLLPEGAPVPNRAQKVEGRWRIDARPVIAGRRAAEAARKRAEGSERRTPEAAKP